MYSAVRRDVCDETDLGNGADRSAETVYGPPAEEPDDLIAPVYGPPPVEEDPIKVVYGPPPKGLDRIRAILSSTLRIGNR